MKPKRNFFQWVEKIEPPTNFYEQYATVAGMYALTLKIEDAIEALEAAKDQHQDPDARKVLEENVQKLNAKYDLMYKRLALQKEFLTPMFTKIANYKTGTPQPGITPEKLTPLIPAPLVNQQQ